MHKGTNHRSWEALWVSSVVLILDTYENLEKRECLTNVLVVEDEQTDKDLLSKNGTSIFQVKSNLFKSIFTFRLHLHSCWVKIDQMYREIQQMLWWYRAQSLKSRNCEVLFWNVRNSSNKKCRYIYHLKPQQGMSPT